MLVIDKIKTQLSSEISLQTKAGLFFSAFDLKGQLLASNGVMKTDRTIGMLLQSFYLGILKKFEPQIKSLIFELFYSLNNRFRTLGSYKNNPTRNNLWNRCDACCNQRDQHLTNFTMHRSETFRK